MIGKFSTVIFATLRVLLGGKFHQYHALCLSPFHRNDTARQSGGCMNVHAQLMDVTNSRGSNNKLGVFVVHELGRLLFVDFIMHDGPSVAF